MLCCVVCVIWLKCGFSHIILFLLTKRRHRATQSAKKMAERDTIRAIQEIGTAQDVADYLESNAANRKKRAKASRRGMEDDGLRFIWLQ